MSHNINPSQIQREELNKLLKDPTKPVELPDAPRKKEIAPAREMFAHVQGSSAGAGSGEFHVYKQSRRREYDRIQLMEEEKVEVGLLMLSYSRLIHPLGSQCQGFRAKETREREAGQR